MKSTLQREGKNQTPKIINILKAIFLLIFCSLLGQLHGQPENNIPDEIKVLLFSSIEYDGNKGTKKSFNEWLELTKNHFEYLDFEYSTIMDFYKPVGTDSIMGKYEIQVYKMPSENSEKQARYLMWYKDFSSEVWLRVGGYIENDVHLLFQHLKDEKITRRKLKKMLNEWESTDSILAELDWFCLLKGYKKNSTKADCFMSSYYLDVNDLCFGCSPLSKNQLNSTFSRLPFYGHFNK